MSNTEKNISIIKGRLFNRYHVKIRINDRTKKSHVDIWDIINHAYVLPQYEGFENSHDNVEKIVDAMNNDEKIYIAVICEFLKK